MEEVTQLESLTFSLGRAAVISDRGLNPKRELNEDSYLMLPDQAVFAVADGVGGQNAGEIASRTTIEILRQHLPQQTAGDRSRALEQIVRFANRSLYEASLTEDHCSGMATTLAALWLDRGTAVICHVGDSRVYRLTEGELYRETLDHSLAEDQEQVGDPPSEQVRRNVITRAIGIEPDVRPDFKRIAIVPGTTFLLCTDGITRHLTDEEIRRMLNEEPDPARLCQAFKEECYHRGARDNLTALVVRLEALPPSASRARTSHASNEADSPGAGRPARLTVPLGDHVSNHSRLLEGDRGTAHVGRSWAAHLTESDLPPNRFATKTWTALIAVALLALSFGAGIYLGRVEHGIPRAAGGQLASDPAERVYNSGRENYQSRRFIEAERDFRQAVSLAPTSGLYRHWLGRTELILKKYADAARSFEQASVLDGDLENYLYAGVALEAQGEVDKAQRALQEFRRRATAEGR